MDAASFGILDRIISMILLPTGVTRMITTMVTKTATIFSISDTIFNSSMDITKLSMVLGS